MNETTLLEVLRIEILVKDALAVYIPNVAEPLTQEDHRLLARVKQGVKKRYKANYHQLYALGLGETKKDAEGIQLDVPGGEGSMCAEFAAIQDGVRGMRHLRTLAVAHQKKNSGEVHLVNPCTRCIGRLLQFFPEARIIIWFQDRPWKVPVRALAPFPPYRNGLEAPPPTPAMLEVEARVLPALNDYLMAISREVEDEDRHLLPTADKEIHERYRRDDCHYVAVGTDTAGGSYLGLHADCPVGQLSVRAETALLSDARNKRGTLSVGLTVGRKGEHDASMVVVPPWLESCERFLYFFPGLWYIYPGPKGMCKMPVRGAVMFPYKRRIKDAAGNVIQRFD